MSTRFTTSCDQCGWTGGTYRSQPQADFAFRKHSCDRQRRLNERATRVAARQADNGPIRECAHKGRHQHGERNAYVLDRCRCRPCRDAAAAYERQRTKDRAYGRPAPYIDAQPTRDHIRDLQAQGMGWKRIANAAGLSESVVWKIIYGDPHRCMAPSKRVRPDTAAAILGVRLDLAAGTIVEGTGTARRVQALVACGWSMSKIADRLGMTRANFTPIAHGRRGVTHATARAVAALYDELWNTPPPRETWHDRVAYSRSRNYASSLDWALPMLWDDIDDPDARPYAEEQSGPRVGGRPRSVIVEDIEWLLDNDPMATADQLAHRLGVTRSAVQHALDRAGRTDLLERLARNARLEREGAA